MLVNGLPDVLNAVNGNADNIRLAKKIVKKIKDNDGKTHDEAKAEAIMLIVDRLPADANPMNGPEAANPMNGPGAGADAGASFGRSAPLSSERR